MTPNEIDEMAELGLDPERLTARQRQLSEMLGQKQELSTELINLPPQATPAPRQRKPRADKGTKRAPAPQPSAPGTITDAQAKRLMFIIGEWTDAIRDVSDASIQLQHAKDACTTYEMQFHAVIDDLQGKKAGQS